MPNYIINKNATRNPGYHHEVHTEDHANLLGIQARISLGWFANEIDAVAAGKKYYTDADGCASCCPRAHKG